MTIAKDEKELKRDSKSLRNRLLSIKNDSKFVSFIASKFPLFPVIPNERAGVWYVSPSLRAKQTVYFKSTDGHFGQWDLSIKRLNLALLPLLEQAGGLVIVDATRSGKRFPDALSKTVPIWCAVLNSVVFNVQPKLDYIPSTIVSPSEVEQINNKLGSLVDKFRSCGINVETQISRWVKKPLRPFFVHPTSKMFLALDQDEPFWSEQEVLNLEFIPIICTSASMSVSQDQTSENEERSEFQNFQYVQGAADDSELWCAGLLESHFWQVEPYLNDEMSTHDLTVKLDWLIKDQLNLNTDTYKDFDWIIDNRIAIGNRRSASPPECWDYFDFIVNCGTLEYDYGLSDKEKQSKYLFLDIPEGKKGQKQLFDSIRPMLNVVSFVLESSTATRILFHCMQGVDRSVAMCMALLLSRSGKEKISKIDVLSLLVKIQASRPRANPTRASIKKINLFFVEGPGHDF